MSNSSIGDQFEELIKIVQRLRGPEGCPWDKEQTSESLISYMLEETYEVIEAIDEKDLKVISKLPDFGQSSLNRRR